MICSAKAASLNSEPCALKPRERKARMQFREVRGGGSYTHAACVNVHTSFIPCKLQTPDFHTSILVRRAARRNQLRGPPLYISYLKRSTCHVRFQAWSLPQARSACDESSSSDGINHSARHDESSYGLIMLDTLNSPAHMPTHKGWRSSLHSRVWGRPVEKDWSFSLSLFRSGSLLTSRPASSLFQSMPI